MPGMLTNFSSTGIWTTQPWSGGQWARRSPWEYVDQFDTDQAKEVLVNVDSELSIPARGLRIRMNWAGGTQQDIRRYPDRPPESR